MTSKLSGRSRLTRAQRTWQDWATQAKGTKPSKYRNRKAVVDGITFDSQREADEWVKLQLMEKCGDIWNLRRQVPFPLTVNDVLVSTYIADFVFFERDTTRDNNSSVFIDSSSRVVADAKGMKTREYVMKKKLMRAIHGIFIREL